MENKQIHKFDADINQLMKLIINSYENRNKETKFKLFITKLI